MERLLNKTNTSLPENILHHMTFAAFQKPISSAAQLVDSVVGTDLTDRIQLVEQPEGANFGSGRWHAQQIAAGIGAAVPFAVAMAISRPISRAIVEKPLLQGCARAGAAYSRYGLVESATAGFVQGSIFEPTTTDGSNLLLARLRQGAVAATALASMHKLSTVSAGLTSNSGPRVLERAIGAALSGAGAGMVSSVTDCILNNRTIDGKELISSSYSMAFTGGALTIGAGSFMRLGRTKSTLPTIEEFVWRKYDGSSHVNNYQAWLSGKSITGRFHAKTLVDMTPIERMDYLGQLQQHSKDSRLVTESALMSLIKHVESGTQSWNGDGISDLHAQYKAAQSKLLKRSESHSAVTERFKFNRKAVETWDEQKGFHTVWQEHPTVVKSGRKLAVAIAERNKASDKLLSARENRAKDLEIALNAFLSEQRLPEVSVRVADAPSGQHGFYHQGRITLSAKEVYTPKLSSEQIGILAHELAHHNQDNLRLRMIADNLKIGKTASTQQIETLRDVAAAFDQFPELKAEANHLRLPAELVENMIKVRNGERLNARDLRLAREIDAENRKPQQHFPATNDTYNAARQLENVLAQIGELRKERPTADVYDLVKMAREQPATFKDVFGFEGIPRALESKRSTSTTVKDLADLFEAQKRNLERKNSKYQGMAYDWYLKSPLEQQAHPIGLLAYLYARSIGVDSASSI